MVIRGKENDEKKKDIVKRFIKKREYRYFNDQDRFNIDKYIKINNFDD